MSKTRKCRLNENELAAHDIAVKLRKMTDEKLVDAFESKYNQGYQNGLEENKIADGEIFVNEKAKLKFLALAKITPGIGNAIYEKIEKLVLQETNKGEL